MPDLKPGDVVTVEEASETVAGDWPVCPLCGEDELYSLTVPATPETIVGCYRCRWKPGKDFATVAELRDERLRNAVGCLAQRPRDVRRLRILVGRDPDCPITLTIRAHELLAIVDALSSPNARLRKAGM